MSQVAAPELEELCRQAFARFGGEALWSVREIDGPPTEAHARAIARNLRAHAGSEGYALAWQIEEALRAA